jgi:hypothetical protein
MKVIEKGTDAKVWKREVICVDNAKRPIYPSYACGARLEIEGSDIKFIMRRAGHQWDDYEEVVYVIECPECNNLTEVQADSIPNLIKRDATRTLDNLLEAPYENT